MCRSIHCVDRQRQAVGRDQAVRRSPTTLSAYDFGRGKKGQAGMMSVNKETVAFHRLTDMDGNGRGEHWSGCNDRMKLTVLAAGVDAFREFVQKREVEGAAAETARQLARVGVIEDWREQ